MNMKDAFRFQNKLKALMCEATAILQDRRNIVKVKTTHLRSKVMSDTQDAVVEEAAPSEYAGHANEVAAFLMSLLEEREKLCRAIHGGAGEIVPGYPRRQERIGFGYGQRGGPEPAASGIG